MEWMNALDLRCLKGFWTEVCIEGWSFTTKKQVLFLKAQEYFLTHFWAMLPFYTPWKQQKKKGFLVFPGGIKWEHWSESG